MPKMQYFSNKFSKIIKRWGLTASASLNLQYWWPEVTWFDQNLGFSSWLWWNRTSKNQL